MVLDLFFTIENRLLASLLRRSFYHHLLRYRLLDSGLNTVLRSDNIQAEDKMVLYSQIEETLSKVSPVG
jgi:hypothetical protein